jgi:ankyrin repeat protein
LAEEDDDAMSIIEAITSGDEERARDIAGAAPQAARERDEDGTTAPLLALYHGRADLARELLPPDDQLDVFEAAAFGRTDRLRELLDEDASAANAFARDGFHPLGLACFFGHVDAARLLLERGADVNALSRNRYIQTAALHAAAASENKEPNVRYELCKLVLDHGADPNLRQGGGARAIDAARQNEDVRLEQLLRDHGAED